MGRPLVACGLTPDPTGNDFPPPWQLLDQGSSFMILRVSTSSPSSDFILRSAGSGFKSRRLLAEAIRHRDTEPVNCLTPEPMAWDLPYFATLVQGSSSFRLKVRSVQTSVSLLRTISSFNQFVAWPQIHWDRSNLEYYDVTMDLGSSFLKYFPQQSRHKNCEHDPQFYRRSHKYQLPKLYHLGNAININTCSKTNIHNQNIILLKFLYTCLYHLENL